MSENEFNPLEYLRNVIILNYGKKSKYLELLNNVWVKRDGNGKDREELKKGLEQIIHDIESFEKFPTETVPVKIFSVFDNDFTTGKPKGYVTDVVRAPAQKTMKIYAEKLVEWLNKKISDETSIVAGKYIDEGFSPTEPLIQYVSPF